jgi:hypothetical protein
MGSITKLPSHYLFKFRPLNTDSLGILNHRELYFQAALKFNDPFDCDLEAFVNGDRDKLSALFERCLQQVCSERKREWAYFERRREYRNDPSGIRVDWPIVPMMNEASPARDQFRSIVYRHRDSLDLAVSLKDERKCKLILESFYASLIGLTQSAYGICCFGGDPNNILMWSHYAEKHTGIALSFDGSMRIFQKQAGMAAHCVHYSSRRSINVLDQGWPGSFTTLFTRKAVEWRYEKETRFISELGSGLKRFKRDALCGIVLGCRFAENYTSERSRLLAKELLNFILEQNRSRPKGRKLHLYLAEKKKGKFGIVIRKVSNAQDAQKMFQNANLTSKLEF